MRRNKILPCDAALLARAILARPGAMAAYAAGRLDIRSEMVRMTLGEQGCLSEISNRLVDTHEPKTGGHKGWKPVRQPTPGRRSGARSGSQ